MWCDTSKIKESTQFSMGKYTTWTHYNQQSIQNQNKTGIHISGYAVLDLGWAYIFRNLAI